MKRTMKHSSPMLIGVRWYNDAVGLLLRIDRWKITD